MSVFRLAPVLLFSSFFSAAEIPPGTHLLLRMVNSVGTRTSQVGDYVYLRTASPLTSEGRIIVPTRELRPGRGVPHPTQRKDLRACGDEHSTGDAHAPRRKGVEVTPHLNSVDSGEDEQKVDRHEDSVKQGATKMQDAGRVAILAGSGASIGGIADQGWKGAGIGAAAGSAVGLTTVLLTRGKEVDLRQGTTLDVVFDRPVVLE